MSVTLDMTATKQIVRDLADVVAVKPDGTRWKACSIKQLQLSCAGLLTSAIEYYEGADVTLRDILDANLIQAVVNTASVPPLAKHVRRMLLHLDADADTGALDTLIAHADASNKERAQVANGNTPSYSLFHDAALQLAQCLDTDGDVPLTTLSKTVYMLLLTAVCPGRERMFLYLRAADSGSFNADEDHTRDVLEALCAEHPKHADSMTLATVLFTAGEPTTLIVGVHGCSDPRKNEYYHEVDLTSPILPAAQDLLPLLHDGLKLLYNDYEAESFLLRAKPDGAVPFGRNWGNDSVLKPHAQKHTAGMLRKAVEQESFRLHMADADAHSLQDCAEVCARCQHKAATAMTSYVRKALTRLNTDGDGDAGSDDAGSEDAGDGAGDDAGSEDAGDGAGDDAGSEDAGDDAGTDSGDGAGDDAGTDSGDGAGTDGSDGDADDSGDESDDDAPGPAMRAVLEFLTAAYEQDRRRKRHRRR